MNSTLNIITKLIAFSDQTINSNPKLRSVDWTRDISGLAVEDPKSEGHKIPVSGSKLVFDGLRSTTLDGTTAFSLALLPINPSLYRITHTGGTNPSFRASRSLTLNGIALTFTVNLNNTVALSVPSLASSDFAAVQVGDQLFVPHTSTGDSSNVLNILNAGFWTVLAKSDNQNLIITRDTSMGSFTGVSETATLTSNSQIRAFGSSGVQIGDSVAITSGFQTAAQKTFIVTAVSDSFIEFISSVALANQTSITPTASGMIFYTETKRFVYIEADQECTVRLNGDSSNVCRVSPAVPGDPYAPGIFFKTGAVFSLTVVNSSSSTLNLLVITAE